jgi:hypothetical protein
MGSSLFSDIECPNGEYTDEFYDWFCDRWSVKNELMKLRADFDNIVRGAYVEWNYIQRGAREDDQKYCDVIVGDGLKVDCKFSWVKTERVNLFPFIKKRYLEDHFSWKQLGINEVHHWSSSVSDNTKITYWFKFTVADGAFHVENS